MSDASSVISSLRATNAAIGGLIDRLGTSPSVEEYLEARARIGHLEAEFDEYNNALSAALGVPSAKSRILRYFQAHVGEVVAKEELAGVAGIFEFQRRIRELRRDEGWRISSMESHAGLRPGEYMLLSADKDPAVASAWDVAERIRSQGGRPDEKLLLLLGAIHPDPVDYEVVRFALGREAVEAALNSACSLGHDIVVTGDPKALRLRR